MIGGGSSNPSCAPPAKVLLAEERERKWKSNFRHRPCKPKKNAQATSVLRYWPLGRFI